MTTHSEKQLQRWIRSQHLICRGTDFLFETVDQSLIERFQICLETIGGDITSITEAGSWPMGPRRSFKILRVIARVPRDKGFNIITYWANHGRLQTRYSEISE